MFPARLAVGWAISRSERREGCAALVLPLDELDWDGAGRFDLFADRFLHAVHVVVRCSEFVRATRVLGAGAVPWVLMLPPAFAGNTVLC